MKSQAINFWAAAACAALVIAGISTAAASEQGSFERTLDVTGPVNLEVTTGSGNIEVRSGGTMMSECGSAHHAESHPPGRNQIQVLGCIRTNNNWFGGGESNSEEAVKRLEANPPILQSGNDIRIGHIDDPDLRRNISISYEVITPEDTRLQSHSGSGNQSVENLQGPVEISTGSGNVKASDVGGTVRAETGSGNISIDHIKGNVRAKAGSGSIHGSDIGGGFEASTGSGDVKLEQTSPGAVRVDTGSGGMQLRGVSGTLEAKTGSGSIEAEGNPTGAWTVHTGSGGVRLRFPSEAAFDIDARTSSGSVSLDHPVTVEGNMGKKEIRGKVHGGGVPVEVNTGSGNIQID